MMLECCVRNATLSQNYIPEVLIISSNNINFAFFCLLWVLYSMNVLCIISRGLSLLLGQGRHV